jgi:hypothetical protein
MTDVLACANVNGKRRSGAAGDKGGHALRYDDVMRVKLDWDESRSLAIAPKRDRKASIDRFGIVELRAQIESLRAENERVVDRMTEDLDALASRLAELEVRARQPLWRRAFFHGDHRPRAARPRRTLSDRLRALFFLDRAAATRRSA